MWPSLTARPNANASTNLVIDSAATNHLRPCRNASRGRHLALLATAPTRRTHKNASKAAHKVQERDSICTKDKQAMINLRDLYLIPHKTAITAWRVLGCRYHLRGNHFNEEPALPTARRKCC